MRYKDIDKMVARFACENGYTMKTAYRKLLRRNMKAIRELLEIMKTTVIKLDEETKLSEEVIKTLKVGSNVRT